MYPLALPLGSSTGITFHTELTPYLLSSIGLRLDQQRCESRKAAESVGLRL
jgi:hypothetical protein